MQILGFEIPGMTLVKVIGRLGNRTMGQLEASDVQTIAGLFNTTLDEAEASGIKSLLVDDSNLGQVAINWLMSAQNDPKFKQLRDILLKPGASASPELDLLDDDYLSRCPECHNPELIELAHLPSSKQHCCVHCSHVYVVDVAQRM